jgi:hypothetical protein
MRELREDLEQQIPAFGENDGAEATARMTGRL